MAKENLLVVDFVVTDVVKSVDDSGAFATPLIGSLLKSLYNVIGWLLHSIVCNFEYKPIRVDTVEHDRYTCLTIWRMDTYDYFSLE